MKLNDVFTRSVVTAVPNEPVALLAQKMKVHNVGAVVVLENERPVGIVTDRDLALALGADGVSREACARDVMTRQVVAIPENSDVLSATRYIRECGVRRLPIVNGDDRVVGLVSLDDLLHRLVGELGNLVEGLRPAPHSAAASADSSVAAPSWIRRMLQMRGIRFEETHHADAETSQELAQREHFTGHRVAKVVVVFADDKPVELVLPASRRVSLARVRKILGAEDARLASEAEMTALFTGCEPGAVAPVRYSDIPVLMDRSLKVEGPILFQAGTHHDALRLDFADWYEMVHPQVATFTTAAEPAHAG